MREETKKQGKRVCVCVLQGTEDFSPKSHSKNQAERKGMASSGRDGSSEDRALSVREGNGGMTCNAM